MDHTRKIRARCACHTDNRSIAESLCIIICLFCKRIGNTKCLPLALLQRCLHFRSICVIRQRRRGGITIIDHGSILCDPGDSADSIIRICQIRFFQFFKFIQVFRSIFLQSCRQIMNFPPYILVSLPVCLLTDNRCRRPCSNQHREEGYNTDTPENSLFHEISSILYPTPRIVSI